MSNAEEVSYKCSADETHKRWGGIEGEVPTTCPECGAEGVLSDENDGAGEVEVDPTGETGEADPTGETGEADPTGETGEADPTGETGEAAVTLNAPTSKYRITGLVDQFDEQGIIRGQYPIGSVQELPVEMGDAAVVDGRAERAPEEVE